jgi:hypothetical protein
MSATRSAIIPAGKARPIGNGSLIADCPFHKTGKHTLYLYPAPPVTRPFFFCFGCGERGPFATNEDGSYTLRAPS